MAYFNPATGYELSLYTHTPTILWISSISNVAGGLFVIMYIVYKNLFKYYKFCFLGFFILLFNRLVILSIPYIRGYYSWKGDNISHIGIMKDILIFGHVPSDIVYPITHILLSELVYITGLPTIIIANHSTTIFSIFYIVSIYLLATSILVTKREQIFATASISCVLFNGYDVYLMPNGWSLLYLPFVLFLYFKSLRKNDFPAYTLLFIITLIIYPFFHPLSSFVVIAILIIFKLLGSLTHILHAKNASFLVDKSYFPSKGIILETVIFLAWILSFQQFKPNIKLMYQSITAGSNPNLIGSMSSTINKLNLTPLEIIELSFKLMGQHFIFLFFTFLSFIILLQYPNVRKNNDRLVILHCITTFFGVMYVSYLLNIIPGLQYIGSDRFLAYLVIFTPIFAGFVLSYIIDKKITIYSLNFVPIICVIIILIPSTISIYNLYPSPYIMQPTPSITQMDMNGARWFLNFTNLDIGSVNVMSPIYRFTTGIVGYTESKKLLRSRYSDTPLPDHFNYTISNNLGNSYIQNKYCMITMFDKTIYYTVWKTIERFSQKDFQKLEQDSTVDKLYSNGETIICYIHKMQEKFQS